MGSVTMGVAIAIVISVMRGELAGFSPWIIVPAVAILMLAVGTVAALGPARRGLRIQPITVLKED